MDRGIRCSQWDKAFPGESRHASRSRTPTEEALMIYVAEVYPSCEASFPSLNETLQLLHGPSVTMATAQSAHLAATLADF